VDLADVRALAERSLVDKWTSESDEIDGRIMRREHAHGCEEQVASVGEQEYIANFSAINLSVAHRISRNSDPIQVGKYCRVYAVVIRRLRGRMAAANRHGEPCGGAFEQLSFKGSNALEEGEVVARVVTDGGSRRYNAQGAPTLAGKFRDRPAVVLRLGRSHQLRVGERRTSRSGCDLRDPIGMRVGLRGEAHQERRFRCSKRCCAWARVALARAPGAGVAES